MQKYFVSYRREDQIEYTSEIMNGKQLGLAFGMKDVTGNHSFRVWYINRYDGTGYPVYLRKASDDPYNRVFIYDETERYILDIVEYPEH